MSTVIDGEAEDSGSVASMNRRGSGSIITNRPVRLGNTGKMDAKARSKYKELSKIGNTDHAMEHLVKKGYATEDTEWDLRFVAATILQLTASVPTEEAVILKAIALVLARVDFESHGQLLTDAVMHALEDPMEDIRDMRGITKKVEGAIEDMVDETLRIRKATEELRADKEEQKKPENETLKTIQQTVARLEEAIQTMEQKLSNPSRESSSNHQPRTQIPYDTRDGQFPPLPEYPSTSRTGPPTQLPPTHTTMLARAAQKARQVLFRTIAGMPPHKLGELTHEQIVRKANVALEALAGKRKDLPEGMTFLGVNLLTRGDIVFDLSNKKSADWLKREDVRKEYMAGFGALTEIIDREHSVVLENVPTTFEPGTLTFDQVEQANELDKGSILMGKWFKKKEDRRAGQRTAFMKVFFKSAESANKAIRNKLLVGGRRCTVRKLLPEPRRCFNCQKIEVGHMAQRCPAEHPTCANCAQPHPTQQCQHASDPSKHQCPNCDQAGHGAGNRDCPAYERKRRDLQGRNSEHLYRFFPTADDTTWELNDPSSADLTAYKPPEEQLQSANNRHLQWIEERRTWMETTKGKGGPSQALRAKLRRDQITKETPAAPTTVGPTGPLRQSTLKFTINQPPVAVHPTDNSTHVSPNMNRRPPLVHTTDPLTEEPRPTMRADSGNGTTTSSKQPEPNNKPRDTPHTNI